MFVIDCNIKRRQLYNFQRIKLAIKAKSINEIARKNRQSNLRQNSIYLPTDRNLTVDSSSNSADASSSSNNGTGKAGGRVDEQIG